MSLLSVVVNAASLTIKLSIVWYLVFYSKILFSLFQETNSGLSFYVPDDCQHELFTDCCPRNVFVTGESVFSLHARSTKLRFSPFVNIFLLKHSSLFTSHIPQYMSHSFHFSVTKYLMTYLCSSGEYSIRFATIFKSVKKILLWD